MKASELRNLIREEVRRVISEDNGVKELTYVINTPAAPYQKFKKQIDALVSQGKLPKYTEEIYKYKYPTPAISFAMTFKKAADVKLIDTIFKSSGIKKNDYDIYNDFAPSSITVSNITALPDQDKKSLKKDESELVLFTSEDTGQNNWSDYNSLVKEYPIVKKLPKDFVKKYLTLDYLYSIRKHKLNTLEKLIAKEFKKVGIDVELGEGDDTTIEMYFN